MDHKFVHNFNRSLILLITALVSLETNSYYVTSINPLSPIVPQILPAKLTTQLYIHHYKAVCNICLDRLGYHLNAPFHPPNTIFRFVHYHSSSSHTKGQNCRFWKSCDLRYSLQSSWSLRSCRRILPEHNFCKYYAVFVSFFPQISKTWYQYQRLSPLVCIHAYFYQISYRNSTLTFVEQIEFFVSVQ